MNFIDAKKKLEEYADGRYHHIEYRITDTGGEDKELIQECSIYIDTISKIFSGCTWEDTFRKLDLFVNPPTMNIESIEEEMKND